MDYKFYIIDDDKVIQRILKNIISKNNLGEVIGISGDGVNSLENIKILKPDIVLVDLLLPGIDGIEIVSDAKKWNSNAMFIMISEVHSKEMISKAYEEGIEFYINKPINVIEVLSIIDRVKEKIKMSMVIQSFEKAIMNMNILKEHNVSKKIKVVSEKDKTERVLAQLGILGEAGNEDIMHLVFLLLEKGSENSLGKYKLSELYNCLNEKYKDQGIESNVGAIEQRIRRATNKALRNIAHLGIEDYSNDIFIKYGSTLFDFKEVRKEMDYARGKGNYGGKISVKKFLEGIIISLRED